jgi:hypothetical protein
MKWLIFTIFDKLLLDFDKTLIWQQEIVNEIGWLTGCTSIVKLQE